MNLVKNLFLIMILLFICFSAATFSKVFALTQNIKANGPITVKQLMSIESNLRAELLKVGTFSGDKKFTCLSLGQLAQSFQYLSDETILNVKTDKKSKRLARKAKKFLFDDEFYCNDGVGYWLLPWLFQFEDNRLERGLKKYDRKVTKWFARQDIQWANSTPSFSNEKLAQDLLLRVQELSKKEIEVTLRWKPVACKKVGRFAITLTAALSQLSETQASSIYATELVKSKDALSNEVCNGIRGSSKYLSELSSIEANIFGFLKLLTNK